ncbi:hypothetical protein BP6252_04999 [Coleophoma cylindrospora]|uniref:Alpha/beta hydrolase fold-3 domain-containing protein n=1 Tax=Coleophoma cylindrospora TaxID=1849047 RepID=A0A3D8RSL5_9HELO|nr:hypothetical protein BP6252_04999 [Coleophoma cylindrospora]
MLYAHGGGYMFGEPLQWIASYERWIAKASSRGFDLVVVAVKYRLSTVAKFPACREDYLAVYCALLDEYRIPPQRIVFCGDSAGGGLVAMSALHIKKTHMPPPSSLVLISPWLDLTLNETLESPATMTDFLITFKDVNPGIVQSLLPPGIRPDDPQVSPLFDDLSSLPPQLLFAGTAEVLLPDSVSWVRKSEEAGNKISFVRGKGEMHTYAMGWPICSSSIEGETDRKLLDFLQQSLV